ncbi:MAG: hypothetical protein KF739_08805 [Cryobacterium sp.]|nr:hypothetical protein [Cryobacterium sp.]
MHLPEDAGELRADIVDGVPVSGKVRSASPLTMERLATASAMGNRKVRLSSGSCEPERPFVTG